MIGELFKKRTGHDPAAQQLLRRLRRQGYPQLTGVNQERVLRIDCVDLDQVGRLIPLFCNPVIEAIGTESLLKSGDGPIVEVCYKRGVTDPELKSTIQAAAALGMTKLKWVRFATRYQLLGVDEATAREIATRFLYNGEVETIIEPGEKWTTLAPQGQAGKVEYIDIASMDQSGLRELSEVRRLFLDDAQLKTIQGFFTTTELRPIRDAEVEMTAAAWSDHCSHTTLRALGLLRIIKGATYTINHPLVLSAFDDNSGVMVFYKGMAICIKGETHISPSSIATYGGIMTKLGGVLRDIMFTGQGAWPIAGTTIMGITDPRIDWKNVPRGALHPLVILQEAIRGIKDYANPMGIPTAWSQYLIHPKNTKCFALGHAVGILPASRALKGTPQTGDFLVLIGGATGRDGLHGATVSSGIMTHTTSIVDSAHVQIGMPIEERVMMEAIPVLRDADCIRACTDCGAAGLSSAAGELGSETGIWVNLAWVPLKCQGMPPWEIWLSESQERGVLAIPAHKLDQALAILAAYNVPASVIGIFTNTKRCQVIYDVDKNQALWQTCPTANLTGDVAIDLPYSFLHQDCPLPKIEVKERQEKPRHFQPQMPRGEREWVRLVQNHLSHFNLSDQTAASKQFDQTVQGATVLPYVGGTDERMLDELFAATPLLGEPYAVGLANAVSQFYGDIDPAGLGWHIMAQAVAKLVAAGFNPDEMVCNANVYTARVVGFPEHGWALVELIKNGYAPASVILRVPVISGKDSSSGTFQRDDGSFIHAPLTLDVLAMARMLDYRRLIPKAFAKPGDQLVLFHPGLEEIHLGGSVLLDLFGKRGDKLPLVNLHDVRKGFIRYHGLASKPDHNIHSRSAIGDGGLMRRLFEMSIGSNNLGCEVSLPSSDVFGWLFGEISGAILFATSGNEWQKQLEGEYRIIGKVTDQASITVSSGNDRLFSESIASLSNQWSKTFQEVAI